jgi:hypothetical protein
METEEIKARVQLKINVEVGSILVREVDTSIKYRVVYISSDGKAVLVSQRHADTSAIIDLTITTLSK